MRGHVFVTEVRNPNRPILEEAYDSERDASVIKTIVMFLRHPKAGMDKIMLPSAGWYGDNLIVNPVHRFFSVYLYAHMDSYARGGNQTIIGYSHNIERPFPYLKVFNLLAECIG